MKKELAIKQIYNDFLDKVTLSDLEENVLDLYIIDKSLVEISLVLSVSTATVSRILAEIKDKYNNYKKLELAKLLLLKW